MASVRLARSFSYAVGLLDFCAGLALIFLPATVLPLAGISMPDSAGAGYLRFVGAFVATVGASFLWAALGGNLMRLRFVLEFTLLFRLSSGTFGAVALARGWLEPGWAAVPLADFILAAAQAWLLAKIPRAS